MEYVIKKSTCLPESRKGRFFNDPGIYPKETIKTAGSLKKHIPKNV
mgnify:CR=1 FL=1